MIRTLIRAGMMGALLLPGLASAAYNDVLLLTDTVITVGGINVTVYSSTANIESMVVRSGNFDITFATNSSITIASADRRTFSLSDTGGIAQSRTCGAERSTLELVGTRGVTVTITPDSTTCSVNNGGGGSGGGGSSRRSTGATVTKAPGQPAQVTLPTQASPQAVAATTAAFARTIARGTKGSNVTTLQTVLAKDPTVYPEGLVTGFYGALTDKAVKKFQEKYNIAKPGDAGYGTVGPKTRAKLIELSK